jgi:hypothetical protein
MLIEHQGSVAACFALQHDFKWFVLIGGMPLLKSSTAGFDVDLERL